MEYQFRPPKNDVEVQAFRELRVRSFAGRGHGVVDDADSVKSSEFFLLLDDKDTVLGGMRVVFQEYGPLQSLPTPKRLGIDIGEMFRKRGVDITGKRVVDVSGIHVEPQVAKGNPGLMVPFISSAYQYAREKGTQLMLVSPNKPFDKVVMAVMKKTAVAYADLGDHEMRWPGKTDVKHLLAYSPEKELVSMKGASVA